MIARPPRDAPGPEGRSRLEPSPDAASDVTILGAARSDASGSPEATAYLETGVAPTFRAPARTLPAWGGPALDDAFRPGRVVDDFEILGLLGEGSLARVYLARQVSLGRHVALKVSAARSAEARALAVLEHEHIVRIFSEGADPERGLRLLCMQYVPGMTLEGLIRGLRRDERGSWGGRTVLEAIDALGPHSASIDPAALRDRELLEHSDWIEAVCLIGARLAEALAYAHARGVLHRDIKPANILVDPYGRPLLADFNLASEQWSDDGVEMFGGSLSFMSPEHLEAFNPHDPTPRDAVDERSDLYSLGVVLFELLTGTSPFPHVEGPARRPRRCGRWRPFADGAPRRRGPSTPTSPRPWIMPCAAAWIPPRRDAIPRRPSWPGTWRAAGSSGASSWSCRPARSSAPPCAAPRRCWPSPPSCPTCWPARSTSPTTPCRSSAT